MFKEVSESIYIILKAQIAGIKEYVKKHNSFIDLQNNKYTAIWANVYEDDFVGLEEKQIKAIFIYEDLLYFVADNGSIHYSKQDILEQDEYWHCLELDDESFLYAQTVLDILENIEEHGNN